MRKRNTLILYGLSFVLFISPVRYAQASACFDPANLAQNIMQYVQDWSSSMQDWAYERAKMKLQQKLGYQRANNDDKNTAAMVKALTEIEVQTTNRKIAISYDPLDNACDVLSETMTTASLEQGYRNTVIENAEAELLDHATPRTTHQAKKRSQQVVERLALPAEEMIPPSRFFGVGGTYSLEEVEQSKDFVDLISRAYDMPPVPAEVDENSLPQDKVARAAAMTQVARRQLVRDVLNQVRINNVPMVETDDGELISRNENIERFVSSRFGGSNAEEWIAKVTNTVPGREQDPELAVSDTEVVRMNAILDAFGLYMEKLNYDEMQKQTQLIALQTQLMLED